MLKSTVSHTCKLYHHNHKKVKFSVFYIAVWESVSLARMILSGLGCRLQTCSCLATEWFNSTFRARFFNYFLLPNWILECELAQRTSDPRLEMSLQVLFFAAQLFPCEYIHIPPPCPPRGKPKTSER